MAVSVSSGRMAPMSNNQWTGAQDWNAQPQQSNAQDWNAQSAQDWNASAQQPAQDWGVQSQDQTTIQPAAQDWNAPAQDQTSVTAAQDWNAQPQQSVPSAPDWGAGVPGQENTAQQNMFGLWMAICVMSSVYLYIAYASTPDGKRRHPVVTALNLLLMAVNIWGLWNSTSRSGILSLFDAAPDREPPESLRLVLVVPFGQQDASLIIEQENAGGLPVGVAVRVQWPVECAHASRVARRRRSPHTSSATLTMNTGISIAP